MALTFERTELLLGEPLDAIARGLRCIRPLDVQRAVPVLDNPWVLTVLAEPVLKLALPNVYGLRGLPRLLISAAPDDVVAAVVERFAGKIQAEQCARNALAVTVLLVPIEMVLDFWLTYQVMSTPG